MQITAEDAEQMHAEKSQSFGSSALRPLRILCATLAWSAVKLFEELLKIISCLRQEFLTGKLCPVGEYIATKFHHALGKARYRCGNQ